MGRLFIVGVRGQAVYSFSPAGRFIRTLPRSGTGAAEGRFVSVDVDHQGRVYCWDERNRQLLVYAMSGELLCRAHVPTWHKGAQLSVSPEGRVYRVDSAVYKWRGGALERADVALPLQGLGCNLGDAVVGDNGYLWLPTWVDGEPRFFRFTSDLRPAGAFTPPRGTEGSLDPREYRGGDADAWGFLYSVERLLTDWERTRRYSPPRPLAAEQADLLPVVVHAFDPTNNNEFSFFGWRWVWGTGRLGHDGHWYTLTYNSLEWGPWNGLRVYRHDLRSARREATTYEPP